jgi:hypothetical protein
MGPVWDPYFNLRLVKTRAREHFGGLYARNGMCILW